MEHLGNDRWLGSFEVDELGRWQYSIVAWIDRFASWRHELERKVEAGQADLSSELAEGAALLGVEDASRSRRRSRREPDLPREAETGLDAPLELIVDRERARVRRLVRALPALLRRLRRRREGSSRGWPSSASTSSTFPPIHPIGVTHRKGRNNTLDGRAGRPGQPLGDRRRARAGTTAVAPGARHARRPRAARRGRRASTASRSRSTSRSSARPTTRG